jgi:hypothetical protein
LFPEDAQHQTRQETFWSATYWPPTFLNLVASKLML